MILRPALFRALPVVGVAGLLGLTPVPCATAAIVTFEFSGTVTDVPASDPGDPFGGVLASGAPIAGSYTFDSNATDSIPDPASGSYAFSGPSYDLTFSIDGVPFGPFGAFSINTQHGPPDFYGVLGSDGGLTFSLSFTGTALLDDTLPLTPSALAGFFGASGSRTFELFYDTIDLQYQVQGVIDTFTTSAVPEPGTLMLLGAGIAAAWRRRRSGARAAPAS